MASGQAMVCTGTGAASGNNKPPAPLELVMQPLHTPQPGPGEVLLRVDVAGLCHSDLHILDGMFLREAAAKKAGRAMTPLALSHEIGGTVIALGEGVGESVSIGKQYVLYPWLGCGTCIQCADPTSDEIFCERSSFYALSQPAAHRSCRN